MYRNFRSITKKMILMLFFLISLSGLLLLGLLYTIYQVQLENERSQASQQINQLLQISLENAMLKRDLPGLQTIISALASQPSIEKVTILNPAGEIRFASDRSLLATPYPMATGDLCRGCDSGYEDARNTTHILNNDGKKILRSVHPVHNKDACSECHGSPAVNPVNGIIVVDYDAQPMLSKVHSGLTRLSLLGLAILILSFSALWWFMSRHVIKPVRELTHASQKLATGNLSARAHLAGNDELAVLGDAFNDMARRLEGSFDEITQHKDYLQALTDAIPDGIRVLDDNFRILHTNQAYTRLLGKDCPPDSICYQHSHGRDRPCPPTLVTCPLVEIRKNQKPIKTMQTFVDDQGTSFQVQVFSAPLMLPSATGKKRCCIVQSIRDLKRDIHYSREQRLSSLGKLAAGVGHEIFNPLTSIRLALKSTLKSLSNNPDSLDESIRYLQLVDGEIDKCIDVTKRLLKLATPQDEFKQLVDINVAITETVSLLQFEGEQRGIRITLELDDKQLRTIASESDIRMIILNIVQNAFHAMPDGGELIISTRIEEQFIVCNFCDTGVGIADEDLPYIFDPFFTKRADKKQGTGLGLAICQSIVDRYNGQIKARVINTGDEASSGTCMTVKLTLADDEN